MTTLFKENWPLGWTPNADDINGDIRGLIRADNLTADKDGVIGIIRGTKKISSGAFSGLVTQIFSKILNLLNIAPGYPAAARVRYVVVGNAIYRNYDPTNKAENAFGLPVITGGGDQGAAFGFGYGHVFITYGTKKIKDDGINQSPLGLPAAATPTPTVLPPPSVDMSGKTGLAYNLWEPLENDTVFLGAATYVEIDTAPDTHRAVAIRGKTYNILYDATAMGGVTGSGRLEDLFQWSVRIGDTGTLVSVKLIFMLDDPTVVTYVTDTTDYFEFEWNAMEEKAIFTEPIPPDYLEWSDRIEFIESARRQFEASNPRKLTTSFNTGINTWSNLQCKRSDFVRKGTNDSLDWRHVRGIKVIFTCTAPQIVVFTDLFFIGGSSGQLDGEYVYLQVDVQDNGFYIEKSLPSPVTATQTAIKAAIHIQPAAAHVNANEVWIFRGSSNTGGFYRIKRLTGAPGFTPTGFDDLYTDVDALRDNIQLDDFQENLPDGVIGMVCNFKGRNWYITYEAIYPSYRNNFSAYDSRYVLQTSGNTEYNLFLTKLNDDTLVLATNNDFYTITGSGGVVLSGDVEFFDLQIRPMGIKSPSISKEFAVREGNLFYRASDGIRVLAGSTCQLLTNDIDLLFRNFTCHDLAPTKNEPMELYYLGISKGQLYYSTPQQDEVRALYVYSFSDQKWRYEAHSNNDSISALFVEEDDKIIYSTALFGDKFLRQLDVGTLYDESNPINFVFRTCFDHNNQPRNRKDTYTFKIVADSGNANINIVVRAYRDHQVLITHLIVAAFNGREEKQFSIYTEIGLVKYYQIEISGSAPVFKLYNFSIDYEPRPEQLTNLRIPPSNLGIAGRKRIPELPLVIDTMDNLITFTPIISGVPQPPAIIRTVDKTVFHYFFTQDVTGYDVGGLLSGGLFEFYELINPREVELLPDPLLYKFVQYNNLNSGARKRFVQYALIINTWGTNVTMTPYVDGTAYAPQIINTNRKQTVVYTFKVLAVGIDIGATLVSSSAAIGFEFFEVDLSETISEKLPPKVRDLTLTTTNYGVAAKKRIRTIPMILDTFGCNVVYTPRIDGVNYPSTTFNTSEKTTVLHYFLNTNLGIPFGIDYGGTLVGECDFEFYEMLKPENVETLPVGKRFDQFGPLEFSKVGKVRRIIFRILATGSSINYVIFNNDVPIFTGSFPTLPNIDKVYEVSLPKGINLNVFRMEIDSLQIFHRFEATFWYNLEGSETVNKKITVK